MNKKEKEKFYTPHLRTGYAPKEHALISHGKVNDGVDTLLPSPTDDDVVVNNISYMEFDYTEDINFDDGLMPDEK